VTPERQAVVLNAVPLLALAGVYLAVAAAVTPLVWRQRRRVHVLDWAVTAVFPSIGVCALVLGVLVLRDDRPLAGHAWPAFAAILLALGPALVVVLRWEERAQVVAGAERRDAEERVTLRDRELGTVAAISNALARAPDQLAIGRVVADEVARLLGVQFAAVALVDGDAGRATGLVARVGGIDQQWWTDVDLDLAEPSGIASAAFDAAPLQVYDCAASPRVSARLTSTAGARSGAWIPMVAEDRVIGVLVLATTTAPRAFSAEELEILQAVAAEAGLALERVRSAAALADALERERGLVAENRRRLDQQTALVHAAQVLTSELELEAVLDRLVEEVAQLLHVDAADCYLFDPDRRVLRCAAVHGLDAGLLGFEFAVDAGLAATAIHEGRPVHSDDYGGVGDRVPSPAYEGFARSLVAPIVWSSETRGVLGVGFRDESRAFGDDDEELLGTLASLAALALRNAESYADRARQARIQRGFYLIAEVLGEPLSLPQTVAAAAQAAAQSLGGDYAAVLMPGPSGLELAGAHGLPEPLDRALRQGLPDSARVLRTAAEERRVLAASQLADDERFDESWRRLARGAGARSLLAIPIEAPRGDEAAVAIVFYVEEHQIADDDLDLARQVARAASGAFERAELYEAERSSRALAQQLARMGSLLATELDPTAVLEEVVEQAPVLLDVDAASILSLEGDELVVTAGVGDEGESALGARTPSTAWPAGDVVQSRAPVAVPDVSQANRAPEQEPVLREGYQAYLGVPLYGREGALHGVLAVYAQRPRSWREEEVEALAALATNASVALSNAELYQRVALEREQSVAILSNIADGIVAVDRDGRIVVWNAAAEQITGIPAEEALGRTTAQVLHRELESEGTGPGGSRLVSIARGGEEIWLSLSEAVMRDPVGAVAGRIFAFRDISAERLVEQMKSDFVSTVSHELRTPLTSIYGFAETLLRQDVDFGEAERRTFLDYIARESERLTSIVDALLNVARLDTGDLQVQLAPTDVGAVVSEVVSTVRAGDNGGGERQHSFVLELDRDAGLTAEADAEKLRQILDQLIANAVKFSPGGGTVTVAARRRRPDAVEVSVVDEGIGIPTVEQQRIFSKFYRADSSNRAGGGAGLGLFIAQGLVTAMGGRIWVDSAEGRGSAFTFELPAVGQGD
jgi:PAS domain S-box-containing protein